jgi:hypothetical protein
MAARELTSCHGERRDALNWVNSTDSYSASRQSRIKREFENVKVIIRTLAVVAVLGVAFFATTLTAGVASADDPEQNALNAASVSQTGIAVGGDVDNTAVVAQSNSQAIIGGYYGGAEQNAANLASVRQFGLAVFGDVDNTALVFQRNRQLIFGP